MKRALIPKRESNHQLPSITENPRAQSTVEKSDQNSTNSKLEQFKLFSKKYGKREILGNNNKTDSWIFRSSKIPAEVKVNENLFPLRIFIVAQELVS